MQGKDDEIERTSADDESGFGSCIGTLLWLLSILLVICTFPLSLFVTMKQVKVNELTMNFFTQKKLKTFDALAFKAS